MRVIDIFPDVFLGIPSEPCFRAGWCAQVLQELLLQPSLQGFISSPLQGLICQNNERNVLRKTLWGFFFISVSKIHFTRPKWLLCEWDEKCSLEHFRFCLTWTLPWPSLLPQAGSSSAALSSLCFSQWMVSWQAAFLLPFCLYCRQASRDGHRSYIFLEAEDVK